MFQTLIVRQIGLRHDCFNISDAPDARHPNNAQLQLVEYLSPTNCVPHDACIRIIQVFVGLKLLMYVKPQLSNYTIEQL
jgi:hypothetical protein